MPHGACPSRAGSTGRGRVRRETGCIVRNARHLPRAAKRCVDEAQMYAATPAVLNPS